MIQSEIKTRSGMSDPPNGDQIHSGPSHGGHSLQRNSSGGFKARPPRCPVNGPSVDTHGKSVAVAWFTDVEKHPEVRVRFSRDSATTFGQTIRVDDGGSAGRVDITLTDTNTAAVSWLKVDGKAAEIRWRVVHRDGTMTPSRRLTATLASRSSGFPRMERLGDDLFFAWTAAVKPSRIHTARVAH